MSYYYLSYYVFHHTCILMGKSSWDIITICFIGGGIAVQTTKGDEDSSLGNERYIT